MKQSPKGATFKTTKMPRVEFLRGVLGRLDNEAGIYFALLQEKHENSPGMIPYVGFWAGIRLLMPVIESVAHILGKTPQWFMGKHLNLKTPYLVWDIYRHSLTHNNLMQHARYGTKTTGWSIGMNGQGHFAKLGTVHVDIISLYQDLQKYLEEEIVKNDQILIDLETGIIYQKPKQEMIDEFNLL